jgi:hypothetical protein
MMDVVTLLRRVLGRLGGEFGPAGKTFEKWLRAGGAPAALVAELADCCPLRPVYAGPVELYSARGVMFVNGPGGIPELLPAGLLVVGSCPTGDPVAVDLRELPGRAGYVNHTVLHQKRKDVRAGFAPLAESLGELAGLLADGNGPADYAGFVRTISGDAPRRS